MDEKKTFTPEDDRRIAALWMTRARLGQFTSFIRDTLKVRYDHPFISQPRTFQYITQTRSSSDDYRTSRLEKRRARLLIDAYFEVDQLQSPCMGHLPMQCRQCLMSALVSTGVC